MGRGELQLTILIEMMRRESYELMSKPEIPHAVLMASSTAGELLGIDFRKRSSAPL